MGSLVVKMAGRYALLALLAYVMIARLRLHPLGLLLGMTALAASATAEAVRSLGRPGSASVARTNGKARAVTPCITNSGSSRL